MKKKKLSNRSLALLAAAVLLLAGSGITASRAQLTFFSQNYDAKLFLNHMQIHLIENGEDVCGGKNTLDGETKVTGELAKHLGYSGSDKEVLGKAEPGEVYREEISARNGQDKDEYVRMTVRKYWVKTDKDGNVIKDEDGKPVKDTTLSPDLIRLTYGKDDPGAKASSLYNKDAWQINDEETTAESATYYCTSVLKSKADTALLFDRLMIGGSIATAGTMHESEEDGYKVYTYEYTYDGAAFFIEADVQAIQTHNAEDAIHSQWGVYNVTEDADAQTLTVRN